MALGASILFSLEAHKQGRAQGSTRNLYDVTRCDT
jgi:hypothetical protein